MNKPTEEQTRNKLVLIGNGFDLAHGLPTKYSNFILWYLSDIFKNSTKKILREYSDNILTFNCSQRIPDNKGFETINDFNNFKKGYNINVYYKSKFIENIINNLSETNWVDIESEYYRYLIDVFNIFKIRKDTTDLNNLNKAFDQLKIELIRYLIGITINQDLINSNILTKMNKFLNDTINHNRKIKDEKDRVNLLFLNFNYTATLDLYVRNNIFNNIKVINIHGRLNDESNPIIFGYGDEMDKNYSDIESINKNEYLKNIKSFSYFKTRNYQDLSLFINSKEFEVYIMGHSCGLSDRILLNSIFENSNCKKIQIYYHQRSENDNDFFEKTQEISRHFKAENKDKMRNLITNFNDCMPLT